MDDMGRSFDLVDWKLAEADFFFKRISECELDFFAVRCYVSAFTSSARSVTFALQSCLNHADGFSDWYTSHQKRLKADPLAKFFQEFRRVNQHIGENPVAGGADGPGGKTLYFFRPTAELEVVPKEDVETACRMYLKTVASIVFGCYEDFGPLIDANQHYTKEYYTSLGKTIDDAEEETLVGSTLATMRAWSVRTGQTTPELTRDELREKVRGWTKVQGYPEAYRWQAVRDGEPSCRVNHLFEEYLGKTVPEPARLPDIKPPSEPGWYKLKSGARVYIPEELRKTGDPDKDLELYMELLSKKRD